ncbi:hypothetical protein DMC30DRAFT_336970, partial [Rhodotorula diobovata]
VLDELDYNGLHKAAQLCKRLKRLTRDRRFDEALFRNGPPDFVKLGTAIEIHPLLQARYCIFAGRDAFTWHALELRTDVHAPRVFDIPAVDEYATSPAWVDIALDVHTARKPRVRQAKGVKVRHVLEELGRSWGLRPPPDVVCDLLDGEVDSAPENFTWITTLRTIGSNCSWTCWRKAVVAESGKSVTMYADKYE